MTKKNQKRPATRRKKKTFGVAESYSQAVSMLKTHGIEILIEQLKSAKGDGCPAFEPGNRIRLDALVKWMAAQPAAGAGTEKMTLQAARLKRLQIDIEAAQLRLDAEKRKYITREEVRERWNRVAIRTRQVCQRIVSEPPNWAGLSAVDLRNRGKAIFDAICDELSDPTKY